MARLNEPIVPAAESVDALKRRFVRQNREIARVNSSQSQRIRNLETEISRLLSENISLREQAIRANEEADKLRTSNRLGRDVVALKAKLATKLEEINLMVEMLGTLPEKAARRSSIREQRNSIVQNLARSPDPKEWKNRQNLGAIVNPELEGRLPAILEDKYYPRRTLDASELRSLGNEENIDNVESPEIGPPPVVHFDVNDPIIFDSNKSPRRVSDGIVSEEEPIIPTSNLETRRKRRTSSLMHDLTGVDEARSTQKAIPQDPASTKLIPRRKVNASELDQDRSIPPQDDFVFSRKSAIVTDRPKPSRFATRPTKVSNIEAESKSTSPSKAVTVTRRALAPKSTNSPSKRRTGMTMLKKDLANTTDIEQDKKPGTSRVAPVAKNEKPLHIDMPSTMVVKSFVEESQPKTPGIDLVEVMSPETASTEPLTKSTKAEMALTNSVEDVLNGSIGRGSRRARAAVSYAEPNLRDKMRRPDKKLVGAVEGLSKSIAGENLLSRSLNSEPPESASIRESLGVEGLPVVDSDRAATSLVRDNSAILANNTAMRQEDATSPLGDKQRSSVLGRRHKRTYSEIEGTSLMTVPRKATEDGSTIMEKMSIYDPPSSSPIAPQQEASERPPSRSGKEGSMTSRRASAASATVTCTALKSRRHSIQVQPPTANVTTARPKSALSTRETASKDVSRLKRASSVQALTRLEDTFLTDGGNDEAVVGRTVTTRRRSMMV